MQQSNVDIAERKPLRAAVANDAGDGGGDASVPVAGK
jgi:hypothetical protein